MRTHTLAKLLSLLFLLIFVKTAGAQEQEFTHDDTLRGSITPQRAWWDLTFYDLKVNVNIADKTISGNNTIYYKVLNSSNLLQIDLQPPMRIEKAEQDGKTLEVQQAGANAYFIVLQKQQPVGSAQSVTVWYSGKPREAVHAPWDGGFSWAKDEKGQPFVATSCQGLGSSIWWPCKDHMYDEPDSQSISITVPKGLMDVSNGRLRSTKTNADGTTTYEWFVSSPINNYGVNVNIANYVHWGETYAGEKGPLTLDYYVLPQNLEKSKSQFKQAPMMMKALEHWFGPYPFYEDGYKLVDVPYLGMEHQSSVTYGNAYRNGYLGMDLSGTGWGKKFDFIIIHESAHEWFANNITYKDIADMWIHEGFANYSEGLYTEYYFGKKAGAEYTRGVRSNIQNKAPIIGSYDVNSEGSLDMYYKGGNLLHTIRQIVNDDEKWRNILRGLGKEFYHQVVTTAQIENYISLHAGRNLQKVFDQYLRSTNIPVLQYRFTKGKVEYRWSDCVDGFDMPVKVTLKKDVYEMIYPTTEWKSSPIKLGKKGKFMVDEDFYVFSEMLTTGK
ncbi:MAG TPA: M1 family metallopeptidase [Saprospiraceae bacterium]|nr:M1 family metallopeptidase [Saprospiraceae bacterium]HPI07776.1 M1 family metallopeptidase [Saprospiraceae bacterium]